MRNCEDPTHARCRAMRPRTAAVVVWVILNVACSGITAPRSHLTESNESTGSTCRPEFPYRDGWLGADAAYSLPIDARKSLWLFGDTLVASSGKTTRRDAKFVRNSIAVSTCDAAIGWNIEYHWSEPNGTGPRAFFDSETDEFWYWPLDGFIYGRRAYVALAVMRDKPGEELFSFDSIGVHLVMIDGLSEHPHQWKLSYRVLTDGPKVLPGSSVVLWDDHVYLFTLYDDVTHQDRHMILTRLPVEWLDSPSGHLEYFAKDHTWKPGIAERDALVVIDTGHSEMSVRHHAGTGTWIAVSDGGFLSDRIMLRTAESLTGPWSGWRSVHRFPEMTPGSPRYDKDTWCYAAKEQAQFSGAGDILVTYNCNSSDLSKQLGNTDIYRPQTVVIGVHEFTPADRRR